MDPIEAHARRLPPVDDRWIPRPHAREHLTDGLLAGKVAGIASHPLDNVRGNIAKLLDGNPDKQFGMSGLTGRFGLDEVLDLVSEAAGVPIDPSAHSGPVGIDPERVVEACEEMGGRLALACERGEAVIVATGHPVGLGLLYVELARLLAAGGAKVVKPAEGLTWKEPESHHHRQIRYLDGVAMLTDKASARHTHSGIPMERMLEEQRPDLVVADHGFAGAAIEAGVEAVSVADVNDTALLVARALGRTDVVIVMDDNVEPDAYWPCFQAIAAQVR